MGSRSRRSATHRTPSWPRVRTRSARAGTCHDPPGGHLPAPRPRRGASVTDHYFSADPSAPFQRQSVSCDVWGQRLDVGSGSGFYSRCVIDIGTSVLSVETEPPAPGRVLDLG